MRSKALSLIFCVLFAVPLFLDCDAHARAGSSSSGSRGSSSSSSKSSSSSSSKSSSSYGNTATKSGSSGTTSPGSYGNTATKSGSSSSTSSGGTATTSPSSSGSSGGYGNTANKPPATGGSPAKGGYGNSAGTAAAVGAGAGAAASTEQSKASSSKTPLQEKMDRSFSKQESAKAYDNYKAQQGKFQKTSTAGSYKPAAREQTTISSISSRVTYTSTSDYYTRRTVFYDSYHWSPPVYIYHSYNSFGIWDAMMLWFMLDHIHEQQYAAMYYNHRDDPGMQQFRREAERLSTENADLKEKLRKADESAKAFEQQGVKPDPKYVPPDAASVVLAANVAEKSVPTKKSSGFPWTWVLVGVGVLAFAGFMLTRRRT